MGEGRGHLWSWEEESEDSEAKLPNAMGRNWLLLSAHKKQTTKLQELFESRHKCVGWEKPRNQDRRSGFSLCDRCRLRKSTLASKVRV